MGGLRAFKKENYRVTYGFTELRREGRNGPRNAAAGLESMYGRPDWGVRGANASQRALVARTAEWLLGGSQGLKERELQGHLRIYGIEGEADREGEGRTRTTESSRRRCGTKSVDLKVLSC